ncbi:hypothetical protein QCA50_013646 [Cerrena zonata]|uniref:Uncharacterized protein n=1 Tax=Cerrena zonata TaxID=2478898 RepID=A0AAW0FV44_9APHY
MNLFLQADLFPNIVETKRQVCRISKNGERVESGTLDPDQDEDYLLDELEQEISKPAGVSTIDQPPLLQNAVFVRPDSGMMYEMKNLRGLKSNVPILTSNIPPECRDSPTHASANCSTSHEYSRKSEPRRIPNEDDDDDDDDDSEHARLMPHTTSVPPITASPPPPAPLPAPVPAPVPSPHKKQFLRFPLHYIRTEPSTQVDNHVAFPNCRVPCCHGSFTSSPLYRDFIRLHVVPIDPESNQEETDEWNECGRSDRGNTLSTVFPALLHSLSEEHIGCRTKT